MSLWHVTNHKLYSGTSTNDTAYPKFIVGTEFGFTKVDPGSQLETNYQHRDDWTGVNQKAHRAAAGNTVLMWGDYFASNPPAGSAAQYMINRFSENSVDYFIPWVNNFDGSWDYYPRGQHSYVTDQSSYVTNGHWVKLPRYNDGNNSAATDTYYISTYGGSFNNSTYWEQTQGINGDSLWHSNWLNRLKTADASIYNKLAAWYIMDEPFNSNRHRDYESNQFSVSGHSAFCSGIEGSDKRPKMVGPGGHSNADGQYTAISGAIEIFAGNAYGGGAETNAWHNPNMVAWMNTKISNETRKMIIPWIWGTYTNENLSKYVFYSTLIEGAMGVIWWMWDTNNSPQYSGYAHQTNIYNMFTSLASFNTGNNYQCDRDVFLTWTNLVVDNLTTSQTLSDPAYFPKTITKRCSIKAFQMTVGGNTYWRIYAVNHMPTSNSYFTADITGTPPSVTAYRRDGGAQSYVILQEQGGSKFRIIDEIPSNLSNGCQFYNIG